jgi:formylglycine-generating enzyme required for sulfatase activity
VCWYEVVAFCQWLSNQAGVTISLPSESEWQRAAQGNDDRCYPWGNDFHPRKCNTKENRLRSLVSIRHYTANVSPFGVCDMVGNVWEWCLNGYKKINDGEEEIHRVMKGGSFMTPANRSVISATQFLNPNYRYTSIGFRIVHNS